ncbi:hypothetical protein [Haloglomus halophilum]|uniref:hypothetical protein n=1 Tax=Haloglomus halophilum TaxID=2962672 RepID=UPI0020C9A2C5|nr:hypothetical protein [Haloglomus halophilum]
MTTAGDGTAGRRRCDWCGEPIGRSEPVTELRALADGPGDGVLPGPVADARVHATVCPDCYAAAFDDPGFEPVAVERAADRRLVLLADPAQVGPVDCRYAAAPAADRSPPSDGPPAHSVSER